MQCSNFNLLPIQANVNILFKISASVTVEVFLDKEYCRRYSLRYKVNTIFLWSGKMFLLILSIRIGSFYKFINDSPTDIWLNSLSVRTIPLWARKQIVELTKLSDVWRVTFLTSYVLNRIHNCQIWWASLSEYPLFLN